MSHSSSNYPDFSTQGYQISREIGRNREGGRITWLALDLNTGEWVVLKQFCFAQAGSNWSAFNAHEREIEVLQRLNHSGIPRYLGAFETEDGFCLVQEYKDAQNLGQQGSFTKEEIKQIGVKVLEILVYLQSLTPAIIHRDIKPENILVDEELNVYLIDFGFARIGSDEVSASSVFKGTPGFIPPEQMRQPTLASDLYGLGATLICLLTGIKSANIQELTDDDDPYQINFRHLLPQISLRFLGWLEKMVQPRQKQRFVNARIALESLQPLDVIRVPGIEISPPVLEFTATRLGERLTQTIKITNPIPDTVLEGRWEVAPHPQDPPHTPDSHAWISVGEAIRCTANKPNTCQISIDTSKLVADKQFQRQLLLHTNGIPETYPITVKVQTAAIPIARREVPYIPLFACSLVAAITSVGITSADTTSLDIVGIMEPIIPVLFFLALYGCFCNPNLEGCLGCSGMVLILGLIIAWSLVIAKVIHIIVFPYLLIGNIIGLICLGICIFILLLCFIIVTLRFLYHDKADIIFNIILRLLAIGLGISLGIGYTIGFFNFYILLGLVGTGLPLATILVYPPIKRRRLIAKYRKNEQHLTKP
ncbi:MAG: serine/threonine-protein kinase [Calothrix sp. MO_167.B12]|nr:serine/threonine-protein kinase [Calothrix sp. MO_167.B12]